MPVMRASGIPRFFESFMAFTYLRPWLVVDRILDSLASSASSASSAREGHGPDSARSSEWVSANSWEIITKCARYGN